MRGYAKGRKGPLGTRRVDEPPSKDMLRELHATLKKGTADARDPVMNVWGFKMASTPSGLPWRGQLVYRLRNTSKYTFFLA